MGEYCHDSLLAEILTKENSSLPGFFNAVFGFLSRHCPEELYGSRQISGEHLVSQSYCKWRQHYLNNKARSLDESFCVDGVVPAAVAEEVIAEAVTEDITGSTANIQLQTSTDATTKTKVTSQGNKSGKTGALDSTTGADRGSYSWTQTIEDLELRVPVPDAVRKGKQVRVKLETAGVEVCVDSGRGGGGSLQKLIEGNFPHHVRAEESVWSLAPGEHVMIHLEKIEERWWDRLLSTEDPIDVGKIDGERDFSTLPDDERQRIRELMWNRERKDQGKKTSDQMRMEGVLKTAWDAEGSPFKGQQFDPSVLDVAANGGVFGTT